MGAAIGLGAVCRSYHIKFGKLCFPRSTGSAAMPWGPGNAWAWNASVLELLEIEFSTRPAQVQGPHCPSAPMMSGVNMIDSHGPTGRDINLKSAGLHEAAHTVCV
jgi:hypothetical protein